MTRPTRQAVAAIAWADLLDRRRAGLGASLFVQPGLLLLILVLSVVAPSLSGVKLGEGRRAIAVDPSVLVDGPGRSLLLDVRASEPRYLLREVTDVQDVVAAELADAGVIIGSDGRLRIVVLSTRRQSKVAAAELSGSLRAAQLARTGVPAPEIERTALKASAEAGRISLAGLLPFLVAFQLLALLTDASNRIRGGKTDRSAEVFQVLPVSRLDLVLGRGVVGLGDGAVRLAAMLVIAAGLAYVPASVATFSVPAATLLTLATAGACQVLVATACGTLIGSLARTEAQEQAVQGSVSILLSLGFIGLTTARSGPLPAWLAGLPFIGPTFWARNSLYGAAVPVEAVLAIGVSLVATVLFAVYAARALDRDGVTLRES